jgi:N-acyl homoserine lactone hydrolase
MKVKATPRALERPLQGGAAGATVAVEPLDTGWFEVPQAFLESAGRLATLRMLGIGTPRSRWWTIPVPSFLIHHPSAGPFLVDTGLHPSVTSKPSANLGRIITRFSRPTLEAGKDIAAQLRSRGLEAKDIKTVVMTHMHFDHTSAMSELGGASFILSAPEWEAATTTSWPTMHGYESSHFDYAFDYRTVDFDGPNVDSYSTFGRTFDLFGDGSVRLAFTPGHTLGHMSVVLQTASGEVLVAGDAIFMHKTLEGDHLPFALPDEHLFRRSLRELRQYVKETPDALVIPGHDWEAWQKLRPVY